MIYAVIDTNVFISALLTTNNKTIIRKQIFSHIPECL